MDILHLVVGGKTVLIFKKGRVSAAKYNAYVGFLTFFSFLIEIKISYFISLVYGIKSAAGLACPCPLAYQTCCRRGLAAVPFGEGLDELLKKCPLQCLTLI